MDTAPLVPALALTHSMLPVAPNRPLLLLLLLLRLTELLCAGPSAETAIEHRQQAVRASGQPCSLFQAAAQLADSSKPIRCETAMLWSLLVM